VNTIIYKSKKKEIMSSAKLTASKLAGVKYHGKNLWQFSYASEKGLTSNEIKNFLRDNATLKDKNTYGTKHQTPVEFMVTTYLPFGPRSSVFHSLEDLETFGVPEYWLEEHGDPKVNHFSVYMRKSPGVHGGNTERNDCFYDCLKKAYGEDPELLPKQIRTPGKLKKYLGLNRNDKVPVDQLYILEDKFNISFTIHGDIQYVSKKIQPQNINMSLSNEHYELRCNKNRDRTNGVHFKEVKKEAVIVYKIKFGVEVETYDGVELKKPTMDEFVTDKQKYEKLYVKAGMPDDLIEFRNKYLEDADILKKETKGFINLYKYEKIPAGSFEIWRQLSKNIVEPEEIEAIEAEYLDKAFSGGLHYSNKGYEGQAYSYDMNSMYLYCMSSLHFLIPTKKGVFKYIPQKKFKDLPFYQYGIYRCNILGEHPFFKMNKKNFYTHYDLTLCKELDIKVEIIEDGQSNCIIYEKDKINGNKMFEAYAKYMYDLKKRGLPVKPFISSLWGYLTQKRKFYMMEEKDKPIEINEPSVVMDCIYEVDGKAKVKLTDFNTLFTTKYARIGPFLTAYARLTIARIAKQHITSIVKINTDSVTSTKDLSTYLIIDNELGHFKIEHQGQCKIIHSNKAIWN
jgi:hypothetical protein